MTSLARMATRGSLGNLSQQEEARIYILQRLLPTAFDVAVVRAIVRILAAMILAFLRIVAALIPKALKHRYNEKYSRVVSPTVPKSHSPNAQNQPSQAQNMSPKQECTNIPPVNIDSAEDALVTAEKCENQETPTTIRKKRASIQVTDDYAHTNRTVSLLSPVPSCIRSASLPDGLDDLRSSQNKSQEHRLPSLQPPLIQQRVETKKPPLLVKSSLVPKRPSLSRAARNRLRLTRAPLPCSGLLSASESESEEGAGYIPGPYIGRQRVEYEKGCLREPRTRTLSLGSGVSEQENLEEESFGLTQVVEIWKAEMMGIADAEQTSASGLSCSMAPAVPDVDDESLLAVRAYKRHYPEARARGPGNVLATRCRSMS